MNVFVDANVLIFILNKEQPLFFYASRILSLAGSRFQIFTSPVCLAIAFYFAEKKHRAKTAKEKIHLLCRHIAITESGRTAVLNALQNPLAGVTHCRQCRSPSKRSLLENACCPGALAHACPELNPVERLFKELRKEMSNRVCDTIEQAENHLSEILQPYFQKKKNLSNYATTLISALNT